MDRNATLIIVWCRLGSMWAPHDQGPSRFNFHFTFNPIFMNVFCKSCCIIARHPYRMSNFPYRTYDNIAVLSILPVLNTIKMFLRRTAASIFRSFGGESIFKNIHKTERWNRIGFLLWQNVNKDKENKSILFPRIYMKGKVVVPWLYNWYTLMISDW